MPVRDVTISNWSGLHARPAAQFAETARRFRSRVCVHKGDQKVDGKSVYDMMLLSATAGTILQLEAEGEDAEACLDALTALIGEKFGEE